MVINRVSVLAEAGHTPPGHWNTDFSNFPGIWGKINAGLKGFTSKGSKIREFEKLESHCVKRIMFSSIWFLENLRLVG